MSKPPNDDKKPKYPKPVRTMGAAASSDFFKRDISSVNVSLVGIPGFLTIFMVKC